MSKFTQGDVLVPTGEPKASEQIIVTGYEGDDLLAYPAGGGFSLRFTPAAVEKYNFRLWTSDDEEVKKVNFGMDCFSDSAGHFLDFEGYDRGKRWNGWACPLLTVAGFKKLREACEVEDEEDGFPSFKLEGGKWQVRDTNEGEYFPINSFVLQTGSETECLVYDLDIGWCFEVTN